MAGKRDPSIYDDRSNIGSSEELDEYGVWVKSEPQDLSSAIPEPGVEELPDFDDNVTGDLDLPDFSGVKSSDFGVEEIEFEELPKDSDLPDGQDPTTVDKDGFTEVSVNDFLDEDDMGPGKIVDFGDLDNIPDLATEDISGPQGTRENKNSDLSNQLLTKIAEELSSIKKELSSLKNELSSVRSAQAESQEAHGGAGGGFFDEEEDEKIALTGDELDNILNTANFTEESGSGESLGDDLGSFESLGEDGGDLPLSGKPDILGDSETEASLGGEETTVEFDSEDLDDLESAPPVDNSRPQTVDDISDDFDVSLDLTDNLENNAEELPIFEDDGLASLRETGFEPVTHIDGDTSYLDEDPLASVEEGEIDLSGAVIDEPDLSDQITENPVADPAIENISIDMDMEEQTNPEGSSENGDFSLEHEETMEIPVMEEPLIDDSFDVTGDLDNFTADSLNADDFTVEPLGEDDLTAEPLGEDDFTTEPLPVETPPPPPVKEEERDGIPSNLKQELKTVLSYMDQLLESLPEDKIEEFAKSEYFDTYKKLFEELGLV
ncbi:MAG: hypothetical protein LBI67_12910 [Treponema sp.]|jgi:hypothetical protein|nr:hypothetical protein [Treponema sp.]